MTDVPAPTPASAPGPKPNSVARIFGVLFSPDETFASIAKRPTWGAPLIVLIALSIFSGYMLSTHIDWGAPAREAMEQRRDLSPEQVERAAKISNSVGKIIAYAGPLVLVIIMLAVSGILLVAFRLFGGEGDYLQAWSATLYAQMPACIKSIVLFVVMLIKGGTALSPLALVTMVRTNPAFLFEQKTHPMAFALAANLDVFSLWVMVLLIIAFAHVARVSKGKSAAIVISLYVIKALVGLIGPAMQSLRSAR
jgi:hypothetical protein